MLFVAPRQAKPGPYPQRPVNRFMQRFNMRIGQPVGFPKSRETIPVIPEQSVLRAHPQEPSPVLKNDLHRQALQAFFFAVEFEVDSAARNSAEAASNTQARKATYRHLFLR